VKIPREKLVAIVEDLQAQIAQIELLIDEAQVGGGSRFFQLIGMRTGLTDAERMLLTLLAQYEVPL
jgi:hypothetical protein